MLKVDQALPHDLNGMGPCNFTLLTMVSVKYTAYKDGTVLFLARGLFLVQEVCRVCPCFGD